MRLGDRLQCSVEHESVVMLMKAGVSIDELSLFERLLWIQKGDGMSAGDGLETRMRRRAGSKSRVRLWWSIMTNRSVLIGIARRLSDYAPHPWDRRNWDSARAEGCGWGFWWRKRIAAIAGQQLSGQQEAAASEAVGEQSEVADAHEAFGQHVEEEAAQELCCVKRHDALLAAMGIVFPAKADALSVEGQQAVIGNGDAMGVAAQVAEHMCGSAEGRLGIYDPLLFAQLSCSKQFPS